MYNPSLGCNLLGVCTYNIVQQNNNDMKKLELKVEWKTNEYYEVDVVTLLLTDEKIATIEKSQQFLKENKDVDSIRVMIDQDCLASGTDYRLSYAHVIVTAGDALYLIATDSFDSANQVETEHFDLDPMDTKITEFITEWGQSNEEVCTELGYDEDDDGSDEMLIGDGYIWFERYQKWFPKSSSMYDQEDEKILEYLKTNYS